MAKVKPKRTVQVSFRLPTPLVLRLKQAVADYEEWPPLTQTDIVCEGIRLVLEDWDANHNPARRAARK